MSRAIFILCVFCAGCISVQPPVVTAPVVTAISGNSMYPTLHDGQRVYVHRVSIKEVKEGDLIVGWRRIHGLPAHEMFFGHRVIGVLCVGDFVRLVTKGDHNREPDPWITTDENFIGLLIPLSHP